MNIQPLNDRVLIKKIHEEEKTETGIFIGDLKKDKPIQKGVVVAIGKKAPMQVKAGDIVLLGKYAGIETHEDHLMIREDEIIGIINEHRDSNQACE